MALSVESLPVHFPVFPLTGALLLPGGNLPLNIFEPRYLAMVRDAMQTHKIIGMVQPRPDQEREPTPQIYGIGCAGRITHFEETDDGRFLIALTGVCRFDVVEELDCGTPYRQVRADFNRWMGDLEPVEPSGALRTALLEALRQFLDAHELSAEWSGIEQAPMSGLVTSLAMICPFEPSEKQALLEAPDLNRQTEILTALMQMDARTTPGGAPTQMH
ncbi:LON peptidase substrate-binding domain-containing protein [Geminicoccus flavidas]|uniref:LON peptidase substrate-binding domain-containing protein n=1 Tax=Geminicoccus flavidas TaxID=2506407 RepID=UPI00135C9274|nr:LON peptidase substrate-binding domain-containing protein [Geminicoccus flavidas]